MAKACGLRIGPRRFELVVIDGSPKKPKVLSTLAGEFPPDAEDPIGAAAFALKAAIKAHRIPMDNVSVAIESRSAAFRRVTLPVTGEAKIEEVLKFEVESQLPQFNIDEVVVDFHVMDAVDDSSHLMVMAVPKQEIIDTLELCQQAGFEPLEIELEASALINSAADGDLCGPEEAVVLVHVGEESSAVAVLDGGKVREMRIVQTGALSYTPHGTPPPAEGDVEGSEPEGPQPIERAEEVIDRLRRELARTVSGARTTHEITTIHVCGFELKGLDKQQVLGLPVVFMSGYAIEGFEGDVHEEYRSAAVAFGTALRQIGGGLMPARLRREELKFSGALERVELPLAVMCLLITTFLGVWFMFQGKERESINGDLYFLLKSSANYMIGDPKKGQAGNLEYPPEEIVKYVNSSIGLGGGGAADSIRVDPQRSRYEQLDYLKRLLQIEQTKLQKRLGNDAEVSQPQSALKGLTLVLDQLAHKDKPYGRVSMRNLTSSYQNSARDGDFIEVGLRICFFADNSTQATENYERLFKDIKALPWYKDIIAGSSEPITGNESGIYLPNLKILLNPTKAGEPQS